LLFAAVLCAAAEAKMSDSCENLVVIVRSGNRRHAPWQGTIIRCGETVFREKKQHFENFTEFVAFMESAIGRENEPPAH
jgi:uncharacterized protein with PhoU and TrkA domain